VKVFFEHMSDFWRLVFGLAGKAGGNKTWSCEINSFQDYETGYHKLAGLLGYCEKTGSAGEIDLIRALLERRRFFAGSLSLADSLFLAAFVSILKPERILEIGTGAGFSSALMAAIMSPKSGRGAGVCVDTIDAHDRYFGDQELAIGCEIPYLIPDLSKTVRVHPSRESNFVRSLAKNNELNMVFIDANHQHPCPLLDVLQVAPCVRPGGWILLHDILLGTLGEEARNNGAETQFGHPFGAEWLFNSWRCKKIGGGNIGAIQLPKNKKAIVSVAKELMRLPFEVAWQSDRRLRREIRECFALP